MPTRPVSLVDGMPETKRYCPRCGRQGVRVQHPTQEVWNCPNHHGEIFRAALKGPELVTSAPVKVEKKPGARKRA